MHKYTVAEMYSAPELNCLFPVVCAVTVPGNAPMRAALVRELLHQLVLLFFTCRVKSCVAHFLCFVFGSCV